MINKGIQEGMNDNTCNGKFLKLNMEIASCGGVDTSNMFQGDTLNIGDLTVNANSISCMQGAQDKMKALCDNDCQNDASVADQCNDRQLGPLGGMGGFGGPGAGAGGEIPLFLDGKTGQEKFDFFQGLGGFQGVSQSEIDKAIQGLDDSSPDEQWAKALFKVKFGGIDFDNQSQQQDTDKMFKGFGYDDTQLQVLNKCNKMMMKGAFASQGGKQDSPWAFKVFDAAKKADPTTQDKDQAKAGIRAVCGDRVNPDFVFDGVRGVEAMDMKKKIWDAKETAVKGARSQLEQLPFFDGMFQDNGQGDFDITASGMDKLFGILGKMKLKYGADGKTVQGFASKADQDDDNVKALFDNGVFTADAADLLVAQKLQTAQKLESNAVDGAALQAESQVQPQKTSAAAALGVLAAFIGVFAL